MKIFLKVFLLSILLMNSVLAETLAIALKKAYETNPELNAEREAINISQQELKISKSSYLPTITLEGSRSEEDTDKLTNQNGSNASIILNLNTNHQIKSAVYKKK